MSEAIESETPEVEEPEAEEPEAEEPSPDEGDGDEEPEARARKPVDWEKRAHNHAGQAARERSRRQAAERRNADLEARLERLERGRGDSEADELMELIGSLREDDEDPVGDIASLKRALKLYRAREVAETQQTAQQRAIERQVNNLRVAMAESEADFAADTPDYPKAAAFYRAARTEELKEAGYGGARLDQKLADDLFGVVRMAIESGYDPAERVYHLAQRRGYKPGAASPADRKLDALDRAASSGVRPGARAAAGILSWGDVAKLDGAARDKAWAKLRERERGRR